MKFNITAFLLASGGVSTITLLSKPANAQFQLFGRRLATDNQSASANAQHPLFRRRRRATADTKANAVDPAIITAEDNGRALQDTTDLSLSMPMAIEFSGGAGGVAGGQEKQHLHQHHVQHHVQQEEEHSPTDSLPSSKSGKSSSSKMGKGGTSSPTTDTLTSAKSSKIGNTASPTTDTLSSTKSGKGTKSPTASAKAGKLFKSKSAKSSKDNTASPVAPPTPTPPAPGPSFCVAGETCTEPGETCTDGTTEECCGDIFDSFTCECGSDLVFGNCGATNVCADIVCPPDNGGGTDPSFNCPPASFVGCTTSDPNNISDECPTVGQPCLNTIIPGVFCCRDQCPRNYCTAKS